MSMIYNDRLDSPVGHFSYKYCPKTAPHYSEKFLNLKIFERKARLCLQLLSLTSWLNQLLILSKIQFAYEFLSIRRVLVYTIFT